MAERTLAAEKFSRETSVHDRDRPLRVGIFDREIAALEHLQAERREITIRDGFRVAARAVAIGLVTLAIDFVLAEVRKRHSEPVTHRCTVEHWIGAERTQGAHEKLMLRVVGRIIALH